MKRRLLCLWIVLALLCTACAQPPEPSVSPEQPPAQESPQQTESPKEPDPIPEINPTVDPMLESYLTVPTRMETPVREYGESLSHLEMTESFVARILYPVGDLKALDDAVENWAQQTTAYYQAESADIRISETPSELTVEYNSYLIDDALVSVKLRGVYDSPHLAHPIDVSASFNASKVTGALLRIEDVLLPGGKETLQNMVTRDAGIAEKNIDKNLLHHWLLTHEGLEITLVRGDYLPMSDGTVVLLYSYETLEEILSFPGAAPQQPPAQEDPIVTPPVEDVPAVPPAVTPPSGPMLALTFDDGPSAHTDRLLDALSVNGAKATFYVVGNMLDGRANTLRRMTADGHEIGGHSWNHRQLTNLSAEELTDQLMSTRAKIYSITGVDATTARPPYGSCNNQVKETAAKLGIALVNWSVDTLDWKYKDADTVYQAVMDSAKDGAIILCHDLHKTTVDAMERAIPALLAEGYQLVTVTELLTSQGGTVNAGTLYYKR